MDKEPKPRTIYLPSLTKIKKIFTELSQELRDTDLKLYCMYLHKVEVRTDLVIEDWVKLLEGDAAGAQTVELTPVDLITDRQYIKSIGSFAYWFADAPWLPTPEKADS